MFEASLIFHFLCLVFIILDYNLKHRGKKNLNWLEKFLNKENFKLKLMLTKPHFA